MINHFVLIKRFVVLLVVSFASSAFAESRSSEPARIPSPKAYYHTLLGLQYEANGEAQAALNEYQMALSEDEGSPFLLTRAAVMFVRQDEPEKAILFLEKATTKAKNPLALNLLADLYSMMGEKKKAADTYQKIIAQKPDAVEGYLTLSRFFIAEHDFNRAMEAIEKGIQANPTSHLGYYHKGKLLARSGAYEQSFEQYQKAISLYPAFELAHLAMAALHEQLGNKPAAQGIYRHILGEVNMEHKEAGLRLVHLLMQEKRWDESMEVLSRLSDDDPDDPDVWLKLSLVWGEQKEFAKALEALQKVMAVWPRSYDLNVYLASLYEATEAYDKAVAVYQELLRDEGHRYDLHLRLGSVYFYRLKKTTEALAEGEIALKIDPKRSEAYLFSGLVLYELARYEEAAQRFQQGIQVAPERPDLHFHLGATYDKLNRFEEVIGSMETAIALDTDYAAALNYLGYSFADRGIRLDEAVHLITRALAVHPDDGYFMDSLGWAYYKQGKIKEGLALLQKAVALVPDDPVILEHLGEAYLTENQRDLAYEAWIDSLKFDPKNEKLKARFREVGFSAPETTTPSDKKNPGSAFSPNKPADGVAQSSALY